MTHFDTQILVKIPQNHPKTLKNRPKMPDIEPSQGWLGNWRISETYSGSGLWGIGMTGFVGFSRALHLRPLRPERCD